MAAKVVLFTCVVAYIVQAISCSCGARWPAAAAYAGPYGYDAGIRAADRFAADRFATDMVATERFAADRIATDAYAANSYAYAANAPYGIAAPAYEYGAFGALSPAASRGGALPVASSSPIPPNGVSVLSENAIEGILGVSGQLPFLGTVGLEGALPTAGSGAVAYGCGNGNVAMLSEGAPEYGYGYGGLGYEAGLRRGCGCGGIL